MTPAPRPTRSFSPDSNLIRVTGTIALDPPLAPSELAYLTVFCESRRWRRSGGPYAVPSNPLAECSDAAIGASAFCRPPVGQPSLVCPWVPIGGGQALAPRAVPATTDEVIAWLGYLVDHFLAPDAIAVALAAPGVPQFEPHAVIGAFAVADNATGGLEAVLVRGRSVKRMVLHPPVEGLRCA